MKELKTRNDFLAIKVGDRIHKVFSDKSRCLRFVGRMPESENYLIFNLIFNDGQHLEHLYVYENDEHFQFYMSKNTRWFSGEYDSTTIGKAMIENLEKRIETVNKVYLKNN